MAKREYLTEAQVETEIARLLNSDLVKLAKKEKRLIYKRRQYLYCLRVYERRGKELAAQGYTIENLEEQLASIELEEFEER